MYAILTVRESYNGGEEGGKGDADADTDADAGTDTGSDVARDIELPMRVILLLKLMRSASSLLSSGGFGKSTYIVNIINVF